MPRQNAHHSRITRSFPGDTPERLVRYQQESGLTWAETARRAGNHSRSGEAMTMQPQEPGSGSRQPCTSRSASGDSGNTLETQLGALQWYAWRNDLDPVRV